MDQYQLNKYLISEIMAIKKSKDDVETSLFIDRSLETVNSKYNDIKSFKLLGIIITSSHNRRIKKINKDLKSLLNLLGWYTVGKILKDFQEV